MPKDFIQTSGLALAQHGVLYITLIGANGHLFAMERPSKQGTKKALGVDSLEENEWMGPVIPMQREASGTTWLPDTTPMNAIHGKWQSWDFMLHSQIFLQYIEQAGPRGDEQWGSINWFMGKAERKLGGDRLGLRTMLSAEPWTVGECGYPDLLQTGESCNGERIHDRQHPHDLFMELSAFYSTPLSDNLALEFYGGPAAEPALGPVAFPHRPSAFPGPLAPISHHWLDSTHISFGVATLGLFSPTWKLEGSAFNAREPDENRLDFDRDRMDSYSGRFTVLPSVNLALQLSGAYLKGMEDSASESSLNNSRRYTASVIYHSMVGDGGFNANTLAFGLNQEEEHEAAAVLLESSISWQHRDTVGIRAEWVQKTLHDLGIDEPETSEELMDLGKVAISYLRESQSFEHWTPGAGIAIDFNFYPKDLQPYYGENIPIGFAAFVSLRPKVMDHKASNAM